VLKACGLTAPVTPTGTRRLYGAGRPTPYMGSPSPSGPRRGDRAPPRGVDVKQPLRGGPGGAYPPLEGVRRTPGRSPGPRDGDPGLPRGLGPRDGGPALRGFTSTPRAGALSPVRGCPAGLSQARSLRPLLGPPGPDPPKWGIFPKKPQNGASPATPAKPEKRGHRAPARGVDVKPPLKKAPDLAKSGRKPRKRPKRPFFAIFGHFR